MKIIEISKEELLDVIKDSRHYASKKHHHPPKIINFEVGIKSVIIQISQKPKDKGDYIFVLTFEIESNLDASATFGSKKELNSLITDLLIKKGYERH